MPGRSHSRAAAELRRAVGLRCWPSKVSEVVRRLHSAFCLRYEAFHEARCGHNQRAWWPPRRGVAAQKACAGSPVDLRAPQGEVAKKLYRCSPLSPRCHLWAGRQSDTHPVRRREHRRRQALRRQPHSPLQRRSLLCASTASPVRLRRRLSPRATHGPHRAPARGCAGATVFGRAIELCPRERGTIALTFEPQALRRLRAPFAQCRPWKMDQGCI